ncbi:hypothetical protein [Rubrivirga sp.]|uniref:hypothetical protein n=1 Tax=Rubrivirga sp. TaxID=1885344 RepID=UPI003B51AEC2
MRAVLWFLLAATAVAQPVPVRSPGSWRIEVATPLTGAGADDPGVRVERRVAGPVWGGAGRTERGEITVFAAYERTDPVVRARLVAGATTAGHSAVGGPFAPLLGVGVDVPLVGPLGARLAAERTFGARGPDVAVVRAGLRLALDRVLPAGAADRLFPDGARSATAHVQVTTGVGLAGGVRTTPSGLGTKTAYAIAEALVERTDGAALGWGVGAAAGTGFVLGDQSPPCHDFGCSSSGGEWVSAGPFVSLSGREARASLWVRGGPTVVVARDRGDRDLTLGLQAGAGLDVFPVRTVGLGVGVAGTASPVVSSLGVRVGLRVRVPR